MAWPLRAVSKLGNLEVDFTTQGMLWNAIAFATFPGDTPMYGGFIGAHFVPGGSVDGIQIAFAKDTQFTSINSGVGAGNAFLTYTDGSLGCLYNQSANIPVGSVKYGGFIQAFAIGLGNISPAIPATVSTTFAIGYAISGATGTTTVFKPAISTNEVPKVSMLVQFRRQGLNDQDNFVRVITLSVNGMTLGNAYQIDDTDYNHSVLSPPQVFGNCVIGNTNYTLNLFDTSASGISPWGLNIWQEGTFVAGVGGQGGWSYENWRPVFDDVFIQNIFDNQTFRTLTSTDFGWLMSYTDSNGDPAALLINKEFTGYQVITAVSIDGSANNITINNYYIAMDSDGKFYIADGLGAARQGTVAFNPAGAKVIPPSALACQNYCLPMYTTKKRS